MQKNVFNYPLLSQSLFHYLWLAMRFTPIFILISFYTVAQDINVEYDKTRDLSRYKTFRIGGGEVITPEDQQQVESAALKKLVINAIENELKGKGLHPVDSMADLVVSYVVGSDKRSNLQQLGPGGMMPGVDSRTWSRDYRMGSLIIDLNDKSNNLIWRVNATTTDSSNDAKQMIEQVVSAGFKKFSLKPKKVKKK